MALSLKNSRNCQSNDRVAPFLNRLVAVGAGHRVIPNVSPTGQLLPPSEHERYVEAEQWSKVKHERGKDLVLSFGEDEVRVFKRTKMPVDAIVRVECEEEVKTVGANGVAKTMKTITTRERVAVSGLQTVSMPKELVATSSVTAGRNITTIANTSASVNSLGLLGNANNISLLGGKIKRLDGTLVDMHSAVTNPSDAASSPPPPPFINNTINANTPTTGQQNRAGTPRKSLGVAASEAGGSMSSLGVGSGGFGPATLVRTNTATSTASSVGGGAGALRGQSSHSQHSSSNATTLRVGGAVHNSNGGTSSASPHQRHANSSGVAAAAGSGGGLDPNAPPSFIPPRMWQQWVHNRCRERDPDGPTAILDRLHAEAMALEAKRLDASRRRRRHHRMTCIYHLKSTSNVARKMGRSKLFPATALHQSHFRVQHAIHGATIHEDKEREDGGDDAEQCFIVPEMCEVVSVFAMPPSGTTGGPGRSPAAQGLGGNGNATDNSLIPTIPELSAIHADVPLPHHDGANPTSGGSGEGIAIEIDGDGSNSTAPNFFSMTQPSNIGQGGSSASRGCGGMSGMGSRACTPNLAPFDRSHQQSLMKGGELVDCSCTDRSTDDEADLGGIIEDERKALRQEAADRLKAQRERLRARRTSNGGGGEAAAGGGALSIINGEASSELERREARFDARRLERSAQEPMLSEKAAHALQFWQDRFRNTVIGGCSRLTHRLGERERHRAFVSNERTHLHLLSRQAERSAKEIALVRQTRSSTPHGGSVWAPVFDSIEGDRRYMGAAQEQFMSFCEFCMVRQFPSTDDEMEFILDLRQQCLMDADSKPSSAAFMEASLAPTFRNVGGDSFRAQGQGQVGRTNRANTPSLSPTRGATPSTERQDTAAATSQQQQQPFNPFATAASSVAPTPMAVGRSHRLPPMGTSFNNATGSRPASRLAASALGSRPPTSTSTPYRKGARGRASSAGGSLSGGYLSVGANGNASVGFGGIAVGGGGIAPVESVAIGPGKSLFHARTHEEGTRTGGGVGGQLVIPTFNRFNVETAMEMFEVYGPMFVRSRGAVAVANHLREECGVPTKDFLALFYSHEDDWGPFCPEMAVLKKRLNQSSL